MYADVERVVAKSARVDTAGIDWAEVKRVGLTADEVFVLTYFADVENQSLRYLRALLGMSIAFEPEVAAFLATWNYEEYFHGYELERLMRTCGVPLRDDRRELKQRSSRFNEALEVVMIPVLSKLYRKEFPAVYLAFGAIQELTTLRGYESLAAKSANPGLRALAARIAKQERRHFAWYYRNARAILASSPRARRLTRALMKLNWVPVGGGVHTPDEVRRLFQILFYPHLDACETVRGIDAKIASLPGLENLQLMHDYFGRAGLV